MDAPELSALRKAEERILTARLDGIRKTISHPTEKGRSLEFEVQTLLRSFLPGEYGVSAGFVAHHTPEGVRLSPQLDVVIYDAVRGGPIARLGGCEVFPLEATYGYVEVKASLRSSSDDAEDYAHNSIEKCIQTNARIRKMVHRAYIRPKEHSTTECEVVQRDWMPLRGCVFAFEARGDIATKPAEMAKRMHEFLKRTGDAHLHGVFVAGSAFYSTRAINRETTPSSEWYHVQRTESNALSAFRQSLLLGLARFPRHPLHWTPALAFYEARREWHKYPC